MLTNPREAYKGQSRSTNMVPFDSLGMISYYIHLYSPNMVDN